MTFPKRVKKELVRTLGKDWVQDDPATLLAYQCDGLTLHKSNPMGVVFPSDTSELQAVVRCLRKHRIVFLPRGAGTGLSGGAVAPPGGVIIEMNRFTRIGEPDLLNRTIRLGPGVVNLQVSERVRPLGLYFVPDPSSQKACTIGGNVGENSGGPHTLKLGVTVNHVLGLEAVLPDGELMTLGGREWGYSGPDLVGLMTGSEGTFGIVTSVTCRLTPLPEKTATILAVFPAVRAACETVSAIIATGVIPAAMEMMDRIAIQAVESAYGAGFPVDAEAVLITELEDLEDGLEEQAEAVCKIIEEHQPTEVRRAQNPEERARIWAARKGAFGALGRISPGYYIQDGVIPRSCLPEVIDGVTEISRKYGLPVANVFHAGDGNLHPLILYDCNNPGEVEKVHKAGHEILQLCLEQGGTLSGEHGIGLEKSSYMNELYSDADLRNMAMVRSVFNPEQLLNPGKVLPHPGRCAETKIPSRQASALIRDRRKELIFET